MSTIYSETAADARAEIARILADAIRSTDRASHTLPNGRAVTVTTEPDTDSNLPDSGDWYGALVDQRPNPHHPHHRYGQRPRECNGRARMVHHDGYTRVWWQPPADVAQGSDTERDMETRIRGWYNDSWYYLGAMVTVTEPCACCAQEKEIGRASLWGVESDSSADYLAEIITDLLAECGE